MMDNSIPPVDKLYVAFRTEDDCLANTNAALLLVINTDDKDEVHGKLRPASNYARAGFANLFEIDGSIKVKASTYFRIEIGTAPTWMPLLLSDSRDAWKPRRVAIWGTSENKCVPLAFLDDNKTELASQHDTSVSIPVPKISLLDTKTPINELLFVIETAKSPGADTASGILVEVTPKDFVPGHPLFLSKTLNSSCEKVFDRGTITIFRLSADFGMTLERLNEGGEIKFTNTACDDWLPRAIYVFALVPSVNSSNLTRMACLLACRKWGDKAISQEDGDTRIFPISDTIIHD